MKKIIFITLIMSLIMGLQRIFAQAEPDSTRYLLSEKTVLSGFGGPFVEFSSVDDQFAVCLGGGAAMIVNKTFYIGGYFEGIMTNHYRQDLQTFVNIEKPRIVLEHGGIWMGYVYKHQKPVHGALSMKLGWGEIDLEGDGHEYNPAFNYDFRDRIFSVIPQLELELNMTRWFRINIGVGYRIIAGIDATYPDQTGNEVDFYDKGDFNSPVGTVTLIFGGHKKDQSE